MELGDHPAADDADPSGFGIVGCGMIISNFHAKAIADVKGTKLAACFDALPAAADRFAAANGCRAYHDLDDMLADPAVDVVTIGTPSGAHMEPAVAAAQAGKHVIVEKPLEITLKRCDADHRRLREEQASSCSTIFPSRFHDSSIELKQAVDAGPLRPAHAGRRLREMVPHAGSTTTAAPGAAPGSSTAAAP